MHKMQPAEIETDWKVSHDLKIYQILVSASAQSCDTVAKEVLVGILYSLGSIYVRRPSAFTYI